MRIAGTIDELTEAQWRTVQRVIKPEYDFTGQEHRACMTFARDGEQDVHAELPLSALTGVLLALNLSGVGESLQRMVEAIGQTTAQMKASSSRIGTNAGHGHVWKRPDGLTARCGGPALCRKCREDLNLVNAEALKADGM